MTMKNAIRNNLILGPFYGLARELYIKSVRLRGKFIHKYVALTTESNSERNFTWEGFAVTEGPDDAYYVTCKVNGLEEFIQTAAQVRSLMAERANGAVMFDIGANIGLFTLQYSKFPGATVHSFEPVKSTYDLLDRNVEQNKLANVTAHNFGLSSEKSEMFIGPADGRVKTGAFTVYADPDQNTSGRGHVASFETMDWFASTKGIERLDFIKVDVEGHEMSVLSGGKETIGKFRPIMELEVAKDHQDKEKIFALLEEMDYDVFVRVHGILNQCTYDTWLENPDVGPDIFARPR